jgi:hypothetical protein
MLLIGLAKLKLVCANRHTLQNRLLPKAALRPRMLFRALHPCAIFASIATWDFLPSLASVDVLSAPCV